MTTTPPTPESVLRAALHDSGDGCWYDADCGTGPEVCKGPDDSWHENQPARILAASPTLASAIALGLAWQRASAALPDGWMLQCGMTVWPEPERRYAAVAHKRDWRPVGWTNEHVTIHADDHRDANGPTPEAALIALAEALEARRG